MTSSLLLTGIGLRPPHYADVLEKKPGVAWLEVHAENFFTENTYVFQTLEKIRQDYPISMHGVGLSLGSADDLNWQHLKKLKDLNERMHPCLLSDHLCWSSIDGKYLHDLLPMPYTQESLEHMVGRIQQVQDYLQRQILIENISAYTKFNESSIPEAEFLVELANRSGCGILLDVSNIYISAANLDFEVEDYIKTIPSHLVQEIHLAGFTTRQIDEQEILIDSHNKTIVPAVWDLYSNVIRQLGRKPTIIEWDVDLPTLDTLCLEAYRAEKIMRENYVPAKLTG